AVLKQALAVPQRAVIESPQGKAVWVAVDKDGATLPESRPIEVGEWVELPGDGPQAHAWVVKKGLAAGDRVIVANLVRLGTLPPRSKIQIGDAGAATTPAPGAGMTNGSNGKGN